MRLHKTLITAVTVLAVTGTAFAADSRDEVNTSLGGTSRLDSGGAFQLVVKRKSGKQKFGVVINYTVNVRSRTVLSFTAYPCKSTSCDHASTTSITLNPGRRRVTFNGRVPVVRRDDGQACVYAQVRDRGPKAKKPGQIVRHGNSKGVVFCRKA